MRYGGVRAMLSAPDFKQKQMIIAQLSRGEKLSFKNDNLVIKNADGDIRHQSTCYRLFALFIVGHLTVTSGWFITTRQKIWFQYSFAESQLKTLWGLALCCGRECIVASKAI